MAHDIGTRLRQVREANGLSQRALAKNTGISNATISLIESRKLNPSVAVLKRILDGIPMHLSAFFADEPEESSPVVYRSGDLVEIGGGKISYRQVGHQLADRSIQILHERYQPGADTGKVALEHTGEEGGVVISGRLELTVNGERHVLGPGDAYYFDSSRPHHFRNVGTESCEVVSACSPPSF
ncbi:MAG: cupin domain-containing protein [Deltaproteobacteria bacterium]|nr:cupin domain-containing protein [Deltaproteobacteria bacterium]